jgi:hypothetical protein
VSIAEEFEGLRGRVSSVMACMVSERDRASQCVDDSAALAAREQRRLCA